MPTLTIDVRAALRDRFRDAFGERLHRLILYGSYARGDATPQSDVDVLVVLTGDTTPADTKTAHEVMHALREKYSAHVSPIVASRERFDTYNQPLYRNVREDGELLFPENAPAVSTALQHHTYPSDISPRGMKQATEDSLDRAHQSLRSARVVLDEADDPNAAVSSAYYAMLHAARAALNEAGEAPKSHRGVQHQLRETYVTGGPLDGHYHSLLSRAEDKRLEADYDASPSITLDEAEQWLHRAEDFVDTVESMLPDAASNDDSAS